MKTVSKRGLEDGEFLDLLKRVDTSLIRTPQEKFDEMDKIVSDLMDFQDDMDDWEWDFVNSIAVSLGSGESLSVARVEKIRELEVKYL